MKFDFSKSTDADLQNKLQSSLDIMISNVLYVTHEIDHVKKIVTEIRNSLKLQTQVDDFYETSPQTDSENKSEE